MKAEKKSKGTGAAAAAETILIAVTGMSPAILTETIWALAVEKPAVVPDRVVAITTAAGKARLTEDLCEEKAEFGGMGVWDALRESLEEEGLPTKDRLRLDVRVIHRWNKRGLAEVLPDIRDAAENEAAADFILDQVRGLVEIPDARVIASIAGGRKTMGALLHAAMTLLGRETDRVTHVLAPEPYETGVTPRFYFPGQPCRELVDRKGKRWFAKDCRVDLADVPFVPIRNLFERDSIKKPGAFNQMAARCRVRIDELARRECKLVVQAREPEVTVNGRRVRLSPAQYGVILFLAERALEGAPAIDGYAKATDAVRERVEKLFALHALETKFFVLMGN